uniref:AP-1 complex-associated regulatory protein n=1 Tax=Phallusia mammillata TaxID=59560 RepID=A0A6F9D5S8_9ASCI|nr:AP-1 complex-associated regulatory protein [Phallusia mammillata]
MEQCFGCLGIIFGNRRRQRLRHLVKYKDDVSRNIGVEFENLMLDEHKPNYGSDLPVITQEEREYIAKRDYNKIIEEQKKVDEQINKQLFEEEEQIRVEEESFLEAQREAERATSMTLSLKEKAAGLSTPGGDSTSRHSLTLEEVEDDFEDFLEEVRSRSIAFRNQVASRSKETAANTSSTSDHCNTTLDSLSFDRGGDGMSSEEDFVTSEFSHSKPKAKSREEPEWDSYTSGVSKSGKQAHEKPLEKRLDPVGIGSPENSDTKKCRSNDEDPRTQAERMFSITDDEDMGDFVHA